MGNDERPTNLSSVTERVPGGIVTIALAVVLAVFLFAGLSWNYAGDTGLTFASVVTSGILTAALAMLYFHQTVLLEGQTALRTQEINREVRRNHSDVLRHRVHAWLGTNDLPRTIDSVEDIMEGSDDKLPTVTDIDVRSPGEGEPWFGSTDEFWVVPPELERDRYFSDLLENHAPSLKERIDEISDLYSDFDDLRDEFTDGFEGAIRTEDEFRVEPDIHLPEWVFERIVKIQRDSERSFEDELDVVLNSFEKGGNTMPDHNCIRYMEGPNGGRSIYVGKPKAGSVKDIGRDPVRDCAKEAIQETVDDLDPESDRYKRAVRSADILDAIEEEVGELRADLIELAGRQVYPGECEYLDQARIDTERREMP